MDHFAEWMHPLQLLSQSKNARARNPFPDRRESRTDTERTHGRQISQRDFYERIWFLCPSLRPIIYIVSERIRQVTSWDFTSRREESFEDRLTDSCRIKGSDDWSLSSENRHDFKAITLFSWKVAIEAVSIIRQKIQRKMWPFSYCNKWTWYW